MKRFLTIFALIALSVGAIGATQTPAGARGTATPPPSPPPLGVPTLPPSTLPTPSGSSATVTIPTSKGTATPAPPADNLSDPNRVGLSGVWEVQIQRDSATTYTHFKLDQKQTVLTGQYLDANGKKFPVAGSIDGKDVRLVVSMPDGSTLTFTGSVDGTSDMLGMLQTPKESVAFTASYRPKYRWLDNISPNPGLGP